MQKFTETCMRPTTLSNYKGQEKVKRALTFYIAAAKLREESLDHIIIYGPSGLGKTTLANIIANEMEQELVEVSAPSLKTLEDLRSVLLNIQEGQILFIDEIHRLSKRLEEILYFAMEDFCVDTTVGDFKERVNLPHFTLIGATTSKGTLSEPLRNRFQISIELVPYTNEHLSEIIYQTFEKLDVLISEDCSLEIARRARGIPRIANGFVRRIADFAMVLKSESITKEIIDEAFDFLGVDKYGFTEQDRRYLKILLEKFRTRPVGIDTLSGALNDDKKTIENTVEPYLIQKGYIRRTPKGRILTEEGVVVARNIEG